MRVRSSTIVGLCVALGCNGSQQDVGEGQGTDASTSSDESGTAGDGDGDSYGMPGEGCSPDVNECRPEAVVCEFSVPEAIDCGELATSDPAEDWLAARQCFLDAAMAGLPVFVLSTVNGVDGDYFYGHAVSPGLVDGGIVVEYHPGTGHASREICAGVGARVDCNPGQEELCLECVDHVTYETVCEPTLPP